MLEYKTETHAEKNTTPMLWCAISAYIFAAYFQGCSPRELTYFYARDDVM